LNSIQHSLAQIQARIQAAEIAAGRAPASVALLAVSKLQPASRVREAFEAGQRAFGENYVREALEKRQTLRDLPIRWHLIGPLQSNKAQLAANAFDLIESVDRRKLIDALASYRDPARGPLEILLQVNIDAEPSKSGCAPEQARELADYIASKPLLKLRGLMSIPAPGLALAAAHARLFELYNSLRDAGYALDCLSAGMSDDLEIAINAGSTQVRVGSALFGARPQ